MTCSAESAVCAQRRAVAVISLFQSFVEDMAYTLSQLKLKEEQQRIEVMTFLSLCLLALVKAYVFMSFL